MLNDQDIREICQRVTLAGSDEQLKAALTELKIAIREHVTEAQNRGIQMLLNRSQVKAGSDG